MSRPIVVTHTFNVPAERLFAALDDHANMGRWLGTKIDLIKSPPDKGVGSVRRLHLGLQTIDSITKNDVVQPVHVSAELGRRLSQRSIGH